MINLRIIDMNFNLIDEITLFESLQITTNYSGVGELDLKINRYILGANELLVDRIIFTHIKNPFVISHREIELDENGKETENWTIKALSLKSWLSKRIILPPEHTANQNKSGAAEMVMKHYVNISAVNPIDNKRKIPNLIIAPDLRRGETISRSARFDTLFDELTTISELTGVGWTIYLDVKSKKFVFEIIVGKDLSSSQKIMPPVTFSPEFGTIESLEFTESKLDYKNMGYIAGQGEGIERRIITMNENIIGHERYELYVDARDVSETIEDSEDVTNNENEESNSRPRPEVEIIADLKQRGNEKLAEHEQILFFGGQILTSQNIQYERDWNCGDIVTLQHKEWGISLDSRVTIVKEIHEAGNPMKIEVVFDKDRPTLIDKLRRSIKGAVW